MYIGSQKKLLIHTGLLDIFMMTDPPIWYFSRLCADNAGICRTINQYPEFHATWDSWYCFFLDDPALSAQSCVKYQIGGSKFDTVSCTLIELQIFCFSSCLILMDGVWSPSSIFREIFISRIFCNWRKLGHSELSCWHFRLKFCQGVRRNLGVRCGMMHYPACQCLWL